jgi:hypothetical protein
MNVRGGGQGIRKSSTQDEFEEDSDGLDADGGYSINTEFDSYDASEEVLHAARRAVDAGLFCSLVGLFVGLFRNVMNVVTRLRRSSMPRAALLMLVRRCACACACACACE